MKKLHKLILLALFVAGAVIFAPEAQAQRLTISIGDRPYYTHGPYYWHHGVRYDWVPGHYKGRRWVRGYYRPRRSALHRAHRRHKRVHRALFYP